MDHVAIDLGSRKSQICVRSADGQIVEEKRWDTARAEGVPGEETEEPGHRGDVRGGVRGRGCREGARARDACGTGDDGEDARRRRSTDEDGSARCARAERGVVPNRSADGARPESRVARAEDDVWDARRAGGRADEGHQHSSGMAARPGEAPGEGKPSDVHGARARRLRRSAAELRGATADKSSRR